MRYTPSCEQLEDRWLPSTATHKLVLIATPTSPTQIELSWAKITGVTRYLVRELVTQYGQWDHWQQLCATKALNYTITGLTTDTQYTIALGMMRQHKLSWTKQQTIQTLPAPPLLPAAPLIDHPITAADSAYTPVTGTLFGPDGPKYTDVQQGGVGDCWLLAALAEVALRDPQAIVNLFTYSGTYQEHGDVVQVYAVHYFDMNGIRTTTWVDTELPHWAAQPTDSYTYARVVDGVLWPALAEKAYAQAGALGYVITSSVPGNLPPCDYDILSGGFPIWAMQAITGPAIVSTQPVDFTVPINLAQLTDPGSFVTLLSTYMPPSQYILSDHAYALIASSNQQYTLYNPWGTTDSGYAPHEYGVIWGQFTCTTEFLNQNFDYQNVWPT